MKIFAHTLVFNEENFIWFAVSSIVKYVDQILIWDTGSTDKTVKIINELIKKNPEKIKFKEVGRVDSDGVTKMRQKMLEESDCDWIIILDGDEVWPEGSIKKVVETIRKKGDSLDAIVVPFFVLLGDIFHYQEEKAGQHKLLGKKGHLQIRAINRKIPGLHIKGTYPLEAFLDENEKPVQQSSKLILLNDTPYFHFTHLNRSSKRRQQKIKYELGTKFPSDFKYPKVLSDEYPPIVPSPYRRRDASYEFLAYLRTPLVHLKRRILG